MQGGKRHYAHLSHVLRLTGLPHPELTLLGRTYAIGYEEDLEETLVERPRLVVANKMDEPAAEENRNFKTRVMARRNIYNRKGCR